jgi:hypothetical protein
VRPRGVAVVGWLQIVEGVIAILLGVLLLFVFPAVGVVVIAVGGIVLFLGRSLLTGKRWARTVDVVLSFFGLLGYGFLLIFGTTPIVVGAVAAMGANLVIMYYLTRPHVKAYFGQPSS